jgi:hypothetical protein
MSRRTLSRSLAVVAALAALSSLVFAGDCGTCATGDLPGRVAPVPGR